MPAGSKTMASIPARAAKAAADADVLPVEAYLDPGSGSMLLQVLLGGFAGIAVIAKLYWNRVTSLFNRKGAPKDSD